MSTQSAVLYVDGACKGNPGIGGWGVHIQYPDGTQQDFCGGVAHATNNQMELTAALEGLLRTVGVDSVTIWTDSSYVQKGITEWLKSWKTKNWRKAGGGPVLNKALWIQLDQACQGRQVDWRWIKGHAGHAGNERADALANQGAEQVILASAPPSPSPAPPLTDWLTIDPLGLDYATDEEEGELAETNPWPEPYADFEQNSPENMTHQTTTLWQAPERAQQGHRQLILDTETTGISPLTERVIEIGVIEMINRKATGNTLHVYLNPDQPVGDSVAIHGITDEFLQDKLRFHQIAQDLRDFLVGGEIIAHNASFDMNFLEAELRRCGLPALAGQVQVTDTLALAKRKHAGQKNSLDALARRYEITPRDRTYHGALLDAEILADVYLAMTGGQVTLDMQQTGQADDQQRRYRRFPQRDLAVVYASGEEVARHEQWLDQWEHTQGAVLSIWRVAEH